MTKANLTKLFGTALAFVSAGSAHFIPSPLAAVAIPLATLLLGWLHLPQPGTVKVSP